MRIAHFTFDHPHRCYRLADITRDPLRPFRDEGGGCGFRGSPQFEWPRHRCEPYHQCRTVHAKTTSEVQQSTGVVLWEWPSTGHHTTPHTIHTPHTAMTRWLHTRTWAYGRHGRKTYPRLGGYAWRGLHSLSDLGALPTKSAATCFGHLTRGRETRAGDLSERQELICLNPRESL
jgi:hypothetical protein